MPQTEVFYFREGDGTVPVLDWILALGERNPRAQKKCFGLVKLLKQLGRDLRRPRADYLRDGVFELRTQVGHVNYRILYGFVGKDVAILASGLTKEQVVPDQEIERAISRIKQYQLEPETHRFSYEQENEDG